MSLPLSWSVGSESLQNLTKEHFPGSKWSPTQPYRTPDNLISSKAKEKKQLGFIPTYENDSTPNSMCLLLSNHYLRLWFQERSQYEKDTYTREQIIKEESKIKRRICQRMMTYRRPSKNQFIEDMITKQKAKKELDKKRVKFKPEIRPENIGGKIAKGEIGTKNSKETMEPKEGATEIEEKAKTKEELDNNYDLLKFKPECNQKNAKDHNGAKGSKETVESKEGIKADKEEEFEIEEIYNCHNCPKKCN